MLVQIPTKARPSVLKSYWGHKVTKQSVFGLMVLVLSVQSLWADDIETDIVLGGLVVGSFVLDYAQTLYIIDDDGLVESNPILGRHPTKTQLQAYFVASGLAIGTIATLMKKPNRRWFLVGVLAVQTYATISNRKLGITLFF